VHDVPAIEQTHGFLTLLSATPRGTALARIRMSGEGFLLPPEFTKTLNRAAE
jgi:hypothetical protein